MIFKSNNKSQLHIYTIFFTIVLDMIGVGILIPIIPFLFDPNSQFSIVSNLNITDHAYLLQGLVLAIFPFFQFLFAPILGELSDHYGRKKIIFFSLLGTLIGHAMTAYAIFTHNLIFFIIGRIIDGATAGNIATCMASVSDVSEKENKAKNMGLVGAGVGIGFLIGPMIGGLLTNINAYAPFIFATLLTLLNLISVKLFVKESYANADPNFKLKLNKSFTNIIEAFQTESLRKLFIINAIYVSGFTFYTSLIGVYYAKRFDLTPESFGYLLTYTGLIMIVTQIIIVPKVFKKFTANKVMLVTMPMIFVTTLVFIFSHNIYLNIFFEIFVAIGFALSNTSMNSTISNTATRDEQGKIMGINSSIQSLSNSVVQVFAGIIAASLTYTFPLFASFVFIFVAWILVYIFLNKK